MIDPLILAAFMGAGVSASDYFRILREPASALSYLGLNEHAVMKTVTGFADYASHLYVAGSVHNQSGNPETFNLVVQAFGFWYGQQLASAALNSQVPDHYQMRNKLRELVTRYFNPQAGTDSALYELLSRVHIA